MGNPFEKADREDEEFLHSVQEWKENRLRYVAGQLKPEPESAACPKCGNGYVHEDGWCPNCDRADLPGIMSALQARREGRPDGAA